MKVAMLTGSIPPEPCGVGDYTARLAEALRRAGVETSVISGNEWELSSTRAWARKLERIDPDVIHIQYPTVGYGHSLGPQGLSLWPHRGRLVITLHEFSQARFLRRISEAAFTLRADAIILTSEYERKSFTRWFPWAGRTLTIPIGSNIPFGGGGDRHSQAVAYFGLIRPKKGLEEFLHLARLVRDAGEDYHFVVIGTPDPRCLDYHERLKQESADTAIQWLSGLSTPRR